jgi:DNA sulfur modification protein DndD
MILDSIRLENFGAYEGVQEAQLTPQDHKPVILFGGMNGGGKTTMLDALQLALYGSRAKISNRGRMGYRDYLQDSIHRNADASEGAGVTLRFRRTVEGQISQFELQRSWRVGVKGVEETFRVLKDGEFDSIFTDHWDEVIEAYLPVGISNLFFFDGEQIKDLAEGSNAAAILGTAISSLLGLDLVDRLDADLRVFERRKKGEGLDPEAARKLELAQAELAQIEKDKEALAFEIGRMVNECGRIGKDLRDKEKLFQQEGGDLYVKRNEFERELEEITRKKEEAENRLRDLCAGHLPFRMVDTLLKEVEAQATKEGEIRQNQLLVDAMEERDQEVLTFLEAEEIPKGKIRSIASVLRTDRNLRLEMAKEEMIFNADANFAARVQLLRTQLVPEAEANARNLLREIESLDEKIARVRGELDRVPETERIAQCQADVEEARRLHIEKLAELDTLKIRADVLARQHQEADARLDRFGDREIDARVAEDDRQRMLRHSVKVRETMAKFRTRVIQRHISTMESLMLESFRTLLRKTDLVHGLRIDPESFQVTLTGPNNQPLPFDRLSAGERQLLATAMLWGLARASGRPIPTVIDTPLGRLDSSHRQHLVERYFPSASHQVLLLSTDEEIVGSYHKSLKPSVARNYLLAHDESMGHTHIKEGYFTHHESTR